VVTSPQQSPARLCCQFTLIRGQIFSFNSFPPCRSRSLPDLVLLRDLVLCLQDFAAAYLSFSFASSALGQVSCRDAEVFRPFYPFSSTVERTLRRPSVLAQGVASHGASTPQRGCLHNAFSVWCSVLPLFPSPNLILAVLFYAMLWTNYYREVSI
jgi:hypothetical protein